MPESFCRRRSYLTPAASKRAFTALTSLRREGHVVDHAGALRRRLAVEVEMQHRLRAVAVQPGAVEAEVGPMADAQAEHADVEVERLLPVLGDDGEMVHADDHRGLLVVKRRAFSGDQDQRAHRPARLEPRVRLGGGAERWRSIGGAFSVPSASAAQTRCARSARRAFVAT